MKSIDAVELEDFLRSLPCIEYTHAVTLTFRQGIQLREGCVVMLTPEIASTHVARLIAGVNRAVYGSSYRRKFKKLAWISTMEQANDRLHYHMAVEFPDFESWNCYRDLLWESWVGSNSPWAHREFDCQMYFSDRWISYICKDGTSAIDWGNTHRANDFGCASRIKQ